LEIFASKVYVLKENGSTLQHIINRIYSFKTQINSSIINEHKHINTANDKGVHPSLGLHLLVQLPMDHYYYLLKVLKNVLYNAQIDQQTAPMASERPKTPSWAFSAPRLAKKRRS
jgi:hypothetical protein